MKCTDCGLEMKDGTVECRCISLRTPEQREQWDNLSNTKKKFKQIMNKSNYTGDENAIVSRYQHVERVENDEVENLLEGSVTVQCKIDGANLSVWWDNGLVIASRNQIIHTAKGTTEPFNGAVEYCLNHKGINNLAGKYILRGEWLVKHTINYPQEAYRKFYVFDVQEYGTMKYIEPDKYIGELIYNEIEYIPTLAKLENPSLKEVHGFLEGPDFLGVKQKEGIVIKNYNYVNKYGHVKWGKIVSPEFKERNRAIFGPSNKKEVEAMFAKRIDEHLVHKTIEKIAHEQGTKAERKNIPEILGRVWHDLFNEELWDFVKSSKVGEFDFKLAQKTAYIRIREFALDYFENQLKEKLV